MYNSFNFGDNLKSTRRKQKLSQNELADSICSQAMLSRIENNEVVPSVILMQQLCQRLNVSIDDILSTDYQFSTHSRNEWLDLMKYFHQSAQYDKLRRSVNELNLFKHMRSLNEQQEFYYYQACSHYFFSPDGFESLALLNKALLLTYTKEKELVTDMELIILSEIGRINANIGNFKVGHRYLEDSMTLFFPYPHKRRENQLAKVFYNYAVMLLEQMEYLKAVKIIDEGISWSSHQKNYYYLDELFLLKAIILQDRSLLDDAIKLTRVSELLTRINDTGQLVGEQTLKKYDPRNKTKQIEKTTTR